VKAVVVVLVVSCTVTGTRASFAYRPFDSTDASVVAPAWLELELGPIGYVRDGPANVLVAPAAIANVGVVPNWEAVLQGRNLVRLDHPQGEAMVELIDTALLLKGVLRQGTLQGATGPSLATEFGALLPTVHGERGAGATLNGILSQAWPAATVHFNTAVTLTRAQRFDLFTGAILEGPYAWTVRPAVEVFVERDFGAALTRSVLLAAIWRVREDLSFDLGLRRAWGDDRDVSELRLGLTWDFPLRRVQ
jgi:hypothetical protein